MLKNEGISLGETPSSPFCEPLSKSCSQMATLWSHEGSGSGGYADHIFKFAAKELFGDDVANLQYKNLR